MSYSLKFVPTALKEWEKLDNSVRKPLKKKLAERLEEPHVDAARLRGFDCAYKIKHRSSGYRLVYEVIDEEVVVMVLAVGKREDNTVYTSARNRSNN